MHKVGTKVDTIFITRKEYNLINKRSLLARRSTIHAHVAISKCRFHQTMLRWTTITSFAFFLSANISSETSFHWDYTMSLYSKCCCQKLIVDEKIFNRRAWSSVWEINYLPSVEENTIVEDFYNASCLEPLPGSDAVRYSV